MPGEFEHPDRNDRGLQYDVNTLIQRRALIRMFSGALSGLAVAAVLGCSTRDQAASPTSTAAANADRAQGTALPASVTPIPTTPTPLSACTRIPAETGGPFPGDGTNGPNALTLSGIVRSDVDTQMAAVTGSVGSGFEASLVIGV